MYSKEETKKRDQLFADGYAICQHCKQTLPIDKFFKDRTRKYGLSGICKSCSKETQRKYSSSHRDSINQKRREYWKNNKGEMQTKKRKREHELKNRYSKYIQGAKSRNIPFELTLNEFDKITSTPCFYCGTLQEDEFGNAFVGVDRVNSDNGYFLSNIVPCCTDCNQMKSNYPLKEWISQMHKIINHLEMDENSTKKEGA